MPGVYCIPCESSQLCGGQTGHLIDTRLMEHQQHVRLEHPDKSAMVVHSVNLMHRIQLHHTGILSSKPEYVDRIITEAIEIEHHPNNKNREDGFCPSKSWKPLVCSLNDRGKSPLHLGSPRGHAGPDTLLLSGHSICPLWALTSVHPDVLASFCYLCSLIPHCTPPTHSLGLSPLHISCLPNTPLHFVSVFSPLDQQKRPFSGPHKLLAFSPVGSLSGHVRAQQFHSVPQRVNEN
jgi:hypothetical protein